MNALDGIHHVTAITGDAPRNVDFYTRVLGLRLVQKTVNQDDPTVYHLFYADEAGSPGADLTFFEYPGARRGRAGAGMVHRIAWRLASAEALGFWDERLGREGLPVRRDGEALVSEDPEGIGLELRVGTAADEPLAASHPEIPGELALQGFDGVRAYAHEPEQSRRFLEQTMGFAAVAGGQDFEARGERRGAFYAYEATAERGIGGAGTVHHVAWSCRLDEQEAWRRRVLDGGASPTEIIDRHFFHSIYFREPSGVLFEIATAGPGFPQIGPELALPPAFEHLRAELEQTLTPLR